MPLIFLSLQKNKIIWCTDSPGFGGAEKSLMRVIDFLSENSNHSFLFNTDVGKELKFFAAQKNMSISFLNTGNTLVHIFSMFFSFVRRFLFCRNTTFIFWCHHLDSFRWLQFFFSFTNKEFYVVERLIPSDLSFSKTSKLTIPIKRIVTQKAKATILCAYSQADNYNRWFAPQNLLVIPNSRQIIQLAAETQVYKKKSFDEDNIRLLSIGRLTRQKDHENIITSISYLEKEKIKLTIIGSGEELELLKSLVDELILNDKIEFAGFQDNPLPYLANADIFILSSLAEGLPGVLIEAMAAQLPCIATNIPGNKELLIHEQTGLLVPVSNPKALANAILRLIKNPEERKRYASNAYEHVLKNYDFSVERQLWIKLINEI